MLYYDRTCKNKGTYSAKNNSSKEYMICCYWLFNYLIKNPFFTGSNVKIPYALDAMICQFFVFMKTIHILYIYYYCKKMLIIVLLHMILTNLK